jgi:putative FmdB family regulatory protein
MPTYVYRREDGSTFEVQQRITEAPLERCPETGQAVSRVISGSAGLIFKGSGFYLTDYARKNNGNGASKTDAKPEKTEAKPESSASKPDGKPAANKNDSNASAAKS